MKRAILSIVIATSLLAVATAQTGLGELVRILDLESAGGTIIEESGDLEFPQVLGKRPVKVRSTPNRAEIVTEWNKEQWDQYILTTGFSYQPPKPIVEDVPLVRKLFAHDAPVLSRRLELPRLGVVDLQVEIAPAQDGRVKATISALQRTRFFVDPSAK